MIYDELTRRMNPIVKAEWLTALRSGDYKQTSGCLRDSVGYCCLGVLTNIWASENSVEWREGESAYTISLPGTHSEASVMPDFVMRWSHLMHSTGSTLLGTRKETGVSQEEFYVNLGNLNDNGFTFEQIADVIEYAL